MTNQLNLFGVDTQNDLKTLIIEGLNSLKNGEIFFNEFFFQKDESEFLFESLLQKVIWEQESMNIYGKMVNLPRLTAWYGDKDKNYSFSGITLNPNPWIDEILVVKRKVEQLTNSKFNSVLLNRYRNGNDSISWHTDAEKELGKSPVIASVNFGAERKFQIRHIKTKEKKEIVLSNGSLIIMQGEFQHFWQHQVPKTNTSIGERINLTFRQIK